MRFTDAQLDAVVQRYRKMSQDEFSRALAEPEFKSRFEAAYERGQKDPSKKFTSVDAAGWKLTQFCVDVPPAEPPEDGGINAKLARKRGPKPICGAAFPS